MCIFSESKQESQWIPLRKVGPELILQYVADQGRICSEKLKTDKSQYPTSRQILLNEKAQVLETRGTGCNTVYLAQFPGQRATWMPWCFLIVTGVLLQLI